MAKTPAHKLAYQRDYYERNREDRKAQAKVHYRANRETRCRQMQARRYRISEADYEELLIQQGGVCAICKQPEQRRTKDGVIKRLAVDHCHASGRVRGLLCDGCNQLLGLAGDDPMRLLRAYSYLTERGT